MNISVIYITWRSSNCWATWKVMFVQKKFPKCGYGLNEKKEHAQCLEKLRQVACNLYQFKTLSLNANTTRYCHSQIPTQFLTVVFTTHDQILGSLHATYFVLFISDKLVLKCRLKESGFRIWLHLWVTGSTVPQRHDPEIALMGFGLV